MPTTPREPIRRITSSYPNDPKSPFFDPTGDEMKPLARLYLTRQRLYEKSCTEDGEGTDTEEDSKSVEVAGKMTETTLYCRDYWIQLSKGSVCSTIHHLI